MSKANASKGGNPVLNPAVQGAVANAPFEHSSMLCQFFASREAL